MVAQGLPWSPNGGTAVATVIAQWTLLVGQRRHNGGSREASASLKLVYNVYNSTHCFTGRPMAFLLPPLSDLWATDLLGDHCATALNMLKTSRRPWRPWRGLNVLCATLERSRQPFCLLCAFNGGLESLMVAQGRQKGHSPCLKGVLGTNWQYVSTGSGYGLAKYRRQAMMTWFTDAYIRHSASMILNHRRYSSLEE